MKKITIREHERKGTDGVREHNRTLADAPMGNTKGNFNKKASNEIEVRELQLFIENDSHLYRSMFIPIVKNLMKKKRNKTYDSELSVKAFYNLANEGAKAYVREYGERTPYYEVFSVADRQSVARELRDSFEEEARLGNYDNM